MDKYDEVAERIDCECQADYGETSFMINKCAAILREAFPETIQPIPSEEGALAVLERFIHVSDCGPIRKEMARQSLAALRAQLAVRMGEGHDCDTCNHDTGRGLCKIMKARECRSCRIYARQTRPNTDFWEARAALDGKDSK